MEKWFSNNDPVKKPLPNVVHLGDILPAFSSFEALLLALRSYPLWTQVLREALLDLAMKDVSCSVDEHEAYWIGWMERNAVDPARPVYGGLSLADMRRVALRELLILKFKEQVFGKFLPEHFRHRKSDLDILELEVARFPNRPLAEEAIFRLHDGGQQSLERSAEEFALGDREEPSYNRLGPTSWNLLPEELIPLVAGGKRGEVRGPRLLCGRHVVVRILSITEGRLDGETRGMLLDELLEQWLDGQITALIGESPATGQPREGD